MSAVDLLLVGREGNGKSSTGNSILNKKEFAASSSSFQVSNNPLLRKAAHVDGRSVSVVDGISLRDTSTDSPDHVLDTISLAERAVRLFPNGFSALIIVLKYGIRFTQQERNAVKIIKSLLGDDVIKKYGIIVMTHGDNFSNDVEESRQTFDDWCRQQTGDIQDLFTECGDRYVLFNNRAKDNNQIGEQFRNLMSKVKKIQSPNYTTASFQNAELGRRKLQIQSILPELEQKTQNVLGEVRQRMHELEGNNHPPAAYLQELDAIQRTIQTHKADLVQRDEGTNSIDQLLLQISVTETSIATRRQRCLVLMEYERNGPPPESSPSSFSTKLVVAACTACVTALYCCYQCYQWLRK